MGQATKDSQPPTIFACLSLAVAFSCKKAGVLILTIRMELCSLHCSSSDTNCLVKCSKDKLSSHVIINSKPKHSSRMLISGCTEIGKALSNRIYVVSDVSTALRDPWSKCLSTRSGGYDTVVVTLKSLGLILVAPRDFIVDATVL